MAQNKPPDIPIADSDRPPDIPMGQSPIGDIWNKINEPTVQVGAVGPEMKASRDWFRQEHPLAAKGVDFGFDVLSGMTSPLSLATTASFGAGALTKIPSLIRAGKLLSIPTAAHGAYTMATDPTTGGKIGGGIELLGGIAGARTKIRPKLGAIPEPNPISEPMVAQNPRMSGLASQPALPGIDLPEQIILTPDIPQAHLDLLINEKGFVPGGVTPDGNPILIRGSQSPEGLVRQPVGPALVKQPSLAKELYDFPRGAVTGLDISAPMRQGMPLIWTKAWWDGWGKMLKSAGSQKAFDTVQNEIATHPFFTRKKQITFSKGKFIEKELPSMGDKMGIELTDVLNNREEVIRSQLAERIPGYGKLIKGSNRAFTAFMNNLRSKTAIKQYDALKTTLGREPTDLELKDMGDAINTLTGRGPLKTATPNYVRGEGFSIKERGFEDNSSAARFFNNVMFSPKLTTSRIRMLNPLTYAQADGATRQLYIRGLLNMGSAYTALAGTAALMGASVSTDPNSSDFGKIKLNNYARIDPGAGFLQFMVQYSRMISGLETSASSNKTHEMGKGFNAPGRDDAMVRFVTNKAHPTLKFVWDALSASEYRPFGVGDRSLQLIAPLIVQDLVEIWRKDPELIPLMGTASAIGMSTQIFEKGEKANTFIDPKKDYLLEGGSPFR